MSDKYALVYNTWQEKTEWVQKDKRFDVLLPWGKHRADVLKEYIDHIEARCAALAAENAGLKDINAWCKTDAFKNMYREFKTAEQLGCPDVDCMHDAMLVAIMHAPEIPATDAFLAEVRASELDSLAGVAETMLVKFANQGASETPEAKGWETVRRQATKRAEQLRKGVQS